MNHTSRTTVPRVAKLALGVAAALLVTHVTVAAGPGPVQAVTQPALTGAVPQRPNIVLITTDDQTMDDMAWMPNTRRLLGRNGVTFSNSLSPHPLCCPARAEILTGQYAQNNGVRSNATALGGWKRLDPTRTIATWLDNARYQTAFVGKYLNGYSSKAGREPGWDIWNPTVRNVYGYYDYTMFNNGNRVTYPYKHNADLVGEKTVQYVRRFSKRSAPFFIWASQVAPHGACLQSQELSCWQPPLAAKRHRTLFTDVQSPSLEDPAFNEEDVSDKPPAIRDLPLRDPAAINDLFQKRIQSLQAVDEAVAATVRALRNTGELANTLIVFTSDNGYLLGEHRYKSKNVPYEQAMSVPLLVRGPGVPGGKVRRQTVTTVDLAATFLDAANTRATLRLDGRSVLPLISDPSKPGYDTVLIQSGPRYRREVAEGWYYRGVRTARYTYVEYPGDGFVEMYDRAKDPSQLTNIARDPAYKALESELARRTGLLSGCSGAGCRATFGQLPDRLSIP